MVEMMTAIEQIGSSVRVSLAPDAESGFARIIEQYLGQNLEELAHRRRAAARLRGRIAMTAADKGYTVTLAFYGDEIDIHDGVLEPLDASISGPYETLVALIQNEANPLVEHLRRRIQVRSSLSKPFFPLRVHNLMKLPVEGERESWLPGRLGFGLIAGTAAAAAIVALVLLIT
jgi:hypothetical protein